MVGVTNLLCSCGNQMLFQPIRGSFFCSSCGKCYWIDDDGIDEEEAEVDVGYPPEDI